LKSEGSFFADLNVATIFLFSQSKVNIQFHFDKCLFYTRDYGSCGWALPSIFPRGTNQESWRPLGEDIRRKTRKQSGIPKKGDAGDLAAHDATIVRDHPSRILEETFSEGELRMGAGIFLLKMGRAESGPGLVRISHSITLGMFLKIPATEHVPPQSRFAIFGTRPASLPSLGKSSGRFLLSPAKAPVSRLISLSDCMMCRIQFPVARIRAVRVR
jgi:hypothetical protein